MMNAVAYCSLLAVGLASFYGLPWFVLLFSTAVLTGIAVLEQRQYRPRLAAIGMTDGQWLGADVSQGHTGGSSPVPLARGASMAGSGRSLISSSTFLARVKPASVISLTSGSLVWFAMR